MVYVSVMGANPYFFRWYSPGSVGTVPVTLPLGARDSVESILDAAGWGLDPTLTFLSPALGQIVNRAYDGSARLRVNLIL